MARRLLLICLVIVGAALLLSAALAPSAGMAASVVRALDEGLFDYPPMPDDLRQLAERSVVLDRDGNRLAIIRDENRVSVSLEEVPDHVRAAVIATEDQDFFSHDGVSWRSVLRAAAGNVRAGEVTSGASTLTQQLVKNLILESSEQSLHRKLQEAAYALELEQRMSKEEILESYLNTAYFGNGTYGIGAAAELYWAKAPAELTVAEGALLAGMLRAPERNDPIDNPANALARRAVVLVQMADTGSLSAADAARLADAPLDLRVSDPGGADPDVSVEGAGRAIVTYVIELLKKDPAFGDHPDPAEAERLRFRALATGGYTIRTTIHPELQALAQSSIRAHLDAAEEPLGALTSLDPRTGEVLAIGFGPKPFGTGPGEVDVNPAVPDLGSALGRQSGSAFKAFALVAALEAGVSPAHTIDTPSPYEPTGHCADVPGGWSPGNYADGSGGVLDMARATAVSSNVYFAHLVDEHTGPEALRDVARRMGVRGAELGGNCAAVLGTDGTYPLDMAAGFGTLANRGIACEPFVIAEVLDRDDTTVVRNGDRCAQAVEPGVAARATALLRGPIEDGTASRNGGIGRPAAGKTGTTNGFKDAWFVGYVPQLSTAVWVGRERGDDPLTHADCPAGMTGGCVPTSIWATYMRQAVDVLALRPSDFPEPPPLPSASVPGVVGLPQGAAERLVGDAGFAPAVELVADHRPAGRVVDQLPRGGSVAPTGSSVVLQVSDGTAEPPGQAPADVPAPAPGGDAAPDVPDGAGSPPPDAGSDPAAPAPSPAPAPAPPPEPPRDGPAPPPAAGGAGGPGQGGGPDGGGPPGQRGAPGGGADGGPSGAGGGPGGGAGPGAGGPPGQRGGR